MCCLCSKQTDYLNLSASRLLSQFLPVYHNRSTSIMTIPDTVTAATTILNFLSLLCYWVRNLPFHLPSPANRHPVYVQFYTVLQQVNALSTRYPESTPHADTVVQLRPRPGAPEGQARATPGAPPRPPTPRPPRAQALPPSPPQVPSRPAPLPCPRLVNKRKSFLPKKNE